MDSKIIIDSPQNLDTNLLEPVLEKISKDTELVILGNDNGEYVKDW